MEGRIISWALIGQLHLETKLCSEVYQTWMVFFSSAWPSARIFFDTVHEPCCCYFKKLRSMFFINRISSDLPIFGMEFQIASWPSFLCTIFIWFFQSSRRDRDRKMNCVCAWTYVVLFRSDDIHRTIKAIFQGWRMKNMKTATFIHAEILRRTCLQTL